MRYSPRQLAQAYQAAAAAWQTQLQLAQAAAQGAGNSVAVGAADASVAALMMAAVGGRGAGISAAPLPPCCWPIPRFQLPMINSQLPEALGGVQPQPQQPAALEQPPLPTQAQQEQLLGAGEMEEGPASPVV